MWYIRSSLRQMSYWNERHSLCVIEICDLITPQRIISLWCFFFFFISSIKPRIARINKIEIEYWWTEEFASKILIYCINNQPVLCFEFKRRVLVFKFNKYNALKLSARKILFSVIKFEVIKLLEEVRNCSTRSHFEY